MKLEPLYDRIILQHIDAKPKPSSPLIMTSNRDDEPLLGKVIAIPLKENKTEKDEIFVGVGDIVVFSKFAGTEIKVKDKTYIIIRQTDILAKLFGEI
ncbi:MAG: co-chaperone GroES [Clostridia bacterium]